MSFKFNMKQSAFYGDLCYIIGYGNSTWEIVGYTFEWCFLHGKVEEEIIYNIKNVHTGEETIAYQEDITVVCRAKYAYEYVKQLDKNGNPPKPVNTAGKEKVAVSKDKEYLTPYQYPESMDGLLEKLSDLLALADVIGEDEYLKREIAIVKFQLKKYKKK